MEEAMLIDRDEIVALTRSMAATGASITVDVCCIL